MLPKDLKGKKFGRLLALEDVGRANRQVLWECQCSCGNKTIVRSSSLLLGITKSCGCLRSAPETSVKLSIAHRGKNNHMYGKTHSPETCAKISAAGSGEKSHSWKGGIAHDPYCPIFFEKDFRAIVLERDNHQCQNPDCWGENNKMCLHHIDYDKKECNPDNLITLCNSCNMRANSDREWNMLNYQELIKMKKENINIRR